MIKRWIVLDFCHKVGIINIPTERRCYVVTGRCHRQRPHLHLRVRVLPRGRHLLAECAEGIGLLACLRDAVPDIWRELFALACHLVTGNEALMHAAQWARSSDLLPVGSLDSRRISELLAAVDAGQRARFFELWCKTRSDAEFLALDITSTSSYSQLIEDVEWGYNRDGESLPQINICMLMGMTSRLPVYQTVYPGSIRDVSTLESVLGGLSQITGQGSLTAVMDKGFYSKRNIEAMLATPQHRFVVAVPFTSTFELYRFLGHELARHIHH